MSLSLSLAAQNTCLCQDANAFGSALVTGIYQQCGCIDLEETVQLAEAYCTQVGIDISPAFSVFLEDNTKRDLQCLLCTYAQNCSCPGRERIVSRRHATIYATHFQILLRPLALPGQDSDRERCYAVLRFPFPLLIYATVLYRDPHI